ncbi:MAG: ImmA/IrrE family metallo-endopeptidase [Candidatus Eisenbacteria bacterium]|nr:ImmA/IrrE family metallo-endopeptidase [Candidatus Eisenbacteria bacterium]
MTLTNALIGRRLKEAREASGLTQETAAEVVGVPRAAIAHIEAGNRSVSTLELHEFSKLYRRPIEWFLSATPEEDDTLLAILYRDALGLAGDPRAKADVERYLDICREGMFLEQLLDGTTRAAIPYYEIPSPTSAAEAAEQGELIAAQERDRLALGDAPISDLPDLLLSQGIWAATAELPETLSGVFFNDRSVGMAILVRWVEAYARQRFSFAHEFAHALLDKNQRVTVTLAESASTDYVETRANAFAAALLLPAGGVRTLLSKLDKGAPARRETPVYQPATEKAIEANRRAIAGSQELTYRDVAILAHHFGVSYPAAAYRLRGLDIVTRPKLDALLKDSESGRLYLSIIGLEPRQSASRLRGMPEELTGRVAHLALEAHRRGKISRGRLLDVCEKLGIKGKELLSLPEPTKAA